MGSHPRDRLCDMGPDQKDQSFNSAVTELHAQLESLRDEWQRAALLLVDVATELRMRDPATAKALQDMLARIGKW